MRSCDGCSVCCKLPGVESDGFHKPMGQWCQHCQIGQGCKIYEQRPTSCRAFQCLWLMDERMPDDLKPNLSKVLFYPPEEQPFEGVTVDLIVMEDPKTPGKWKEGAVGRMIHSFQRQGLTLCIVSGNQNQLLRPQSVI